MFSSSERTIEKIVSQKVYKNYFAFGVSKFVVTTCLSLITLLLTNLSPITLGKSLIVSTVKPSLIFSTKVSNNAPIFELSSTRFPYIDDYSSQSVLVYDLNSDVTVYAKNSNKRTLIASLTKLASTKVLLDSIDITQSASIDDSTEKITGSSLELRSGEKFSKNDLIKAAIVASSNQGVFAANNPTETVQRMNEYVKALGLPNTHFSNPAGFDDSENYSTAEDLVSIAKLFFRNEILKSYASTSATTITDLQDNKMINISNTNDLLKMKYPGVIAGKTGTTPGAEQNLVLLVQKNNRQYLVILLNGIDRYNDAFKVLNRL